VVIACLTVVDPIVAVLLGAVLLGEGSATPAETWLLLVTAAVIATAGVVALARHHPDAVAARAARAGAVPSGPSSPEGAQTPAAYARSAQSPHDR
jgi:hypothetical protein